MEQPKHCVKCSYSVEHMTKTETAELAVIEQNETVETSGGSGPSTGNHWSQTKSSDDEGDEKSEVKGEDN